MSYLNSRAVYLDSEWTRLLLKRIDTAMRHIGWFGFLKFNVKRFENLSNNLRLEFDQEDSNNEESTFMRVC